MYCRQIFTTCFRAKAVGSFSNGFLNSSFEIISSCDCVIRFLANVYLQLLQQMFCKTVCKAISSMQCVRSKLGHNNRWFSGVLGMQLLTYALCMVMPISKTFIASSGLRSGIDIILQTRASLSDIARRSQASC